MILTPEQQALLDGAKGETMAKVVKTLVMYGDAFGAERMVPVTSKYGHTVISFGLKAIKPVYELYDQLLDAGLVSGQKFTADPKPLDPNVPSSLLEDIVFKKIMYTDQKPYEEQLRKLGITSDDDYTCACYLDEVGNKPEKGDVLSWAESSAVVYANSVLGARCNRPEAQLLGSAIGMKVMEDVPYVKGLDKWLGCELDKAACAYLKDFGAATASNGAVGLYHIENLTPEAKELGEALIREGAQVYVIDDAELERVKRSYPVIWKDPEARPQLCFVGCPHLTMQQLIDWTDKIEAALRAKHLPQVTVPTVFTASTPVLKEFEKTVYASKLRTYGVILSYICPLMYMNNPLCKKKAVITCSNKLRTYTSARYYTEAEILSIITTKEAAK